MWFFFHKNSFLKQLVMASRPTLGAIFHHPFNRALFNGSAMISRTTPYTTDHIPFEPCFTTYLLNDIDYLVAFQQVMQVAAKRLRPLHAEVANLMERVSSMIVSEMDMHHMYRNYLSEARIATYQRSPAIHAYINELWQLSETPPLVFLSGITACLWTYKQLPEIYRNQVINENHPNYLWISAYKDPQFIMLVADLIKLLDKLELSARAPEKKNAKMAFQRCVTHELNFYNGVLGVDLECIAVASPPL